MGVRKIKLNAFLMGLVTLILIGFIGAAIYFQDTLEIVNFKYNHKSQQLELTKEELQYQLNQLNQLNNSYQNLSSDLESYTTEFDTVYSVCEKERRALSQELDKMSRDLLAQKQKVQEKIAELNNLKNKLSTIKSNLDDENEDINEIIDKVDDINSISSSLEEDIQDKNNANLTLSECRSFLSDVEDDVSRIESKSDSIQGNGGRISNFLSGLEDDLTNIISSISNY